MPIVPEIAPTMHKATVITGFRDGPPVPIVPEIASTMHKATVIQGMGFRVKDLGLAPLCS